MKINWLYTTAIALVISAGAAIAQAPDASQKREEGTRAQSPAAQSKEADRPAAGERMKERAGQAEQKAGQSEQKGGAKDMQRGEGPGERSKQAQEPPGRAGKEPTKQSREQGRDQDRRDRPAADTAQKGKDQPKAGDAKQQATDEKMRGREDRSKDRAQDAKQPADTKQQSQQQMDRDRKDKDQAAQPSGTSTQQSGRPTDATQDQRQGQKTGQSTDQANQRTTSVNDDQRKQIVDQLRRDRSASSNINVRVNIGERLPPRVQPRRLPADIVRIAPQYRNYEYTVIDNRVVIVDPRRREVIDILDEGPGYGRAAGYGRERIVFTGEQRSRWRELARSSVTVGSTSPSGGAASSSGGALASNCLSLQPVPEEMVRSRPELSSYRYLAIGDEIVLVDPQTQKIVQVID
jgi:hypothetical protein